MTENLLTLRAGSPVRNKMFGFFGEVTEHLVNSTPKKTFFTTTIQWDNENLSVYEYESLSECDFEIFPPLKKDTDARKMFEHFSAGARITNNNTKNHGTVFDCIKMSHIDEDVDYFAVTIFWEQGQKQTLFLTVEDIKKFSLDQHEQAQEPAHTRSFIPGERVRNEHTNRNGTVISYHAVDGVLNVCRVLVVSWDGKPNELEALATESKCPFEHIYKKFGSNK